METIEDIIHGCTKDTVISVIDKRSDQLLFKGSGIAFFAHFLDKMDEYGNLEVVCWRRVGNDEIEIGLK